MRHPDTNERICEVCNQPFKYQYARSDRHTCSNKCRQQAYRDRISRADQAARTERLAKANAAIKRTRPKKDSKSRPKKTR